MDADAARLIRRAWRGQVLFWLFFLLVVFLPAGTVRFWQGWLFAIVFIAATSAIGLYFLIHDPKLVERRLNIGPAAETEPAQKIVMSLLSLGFLLLLVVPGLDRRWHWSAVSPWVTIVADLGMVASFFIFFFVMKQNSYAASTIRVEPDQPVVSTGLYGCVRHPMYAGALLLVACIPPALGSWWGLLAAAAALPALAWRLIDEERFLTRNLPGYADYCRQVRCRLIPGLW